MQQLLKAQSATTQDIEYEFPTDGGTEYVVVLIGGGGAGGPARGAKGTTPGGSGGGGGGAVVLKIFGNGGVMKYKPGGVATASTSKVNGKNTTFSYGSIVATANGGTGGMNNGAATPGGSGTVTGTSSNNYKIYDGTTGGAMSPYHQAGTPSSPGGSFDPPREHRGSPGSGAYSNGSAYDSAGGGGGVAGFDYTWTGLAGSLFNPVHMGAGGNGGRGQFNAGSAETVATAGWGFGSGGGGRGANSQTSSLYAGGGGAGGLVLILQSKVEESTGDHPVSEHSTTMNFGEIKVSDVNVATRQFINATQAGRSEANLLAGFTRYQQNSSLKTLSEWVGGMYFSADPSGGEDNSLSVGPHAYTMYPGFKGHLATHNNLTPSNISLGDMRQHTPITVMTRVSCRSNANNYYNGTDGQIVLRPFGVNGLNQTFSVSIAGETKTYASNKSPAGGWWTGLGDGTLSSSSFQGYRIKIGWSYAYGNKIPPSIAAQTIKNMAIGMGVGSQGATFHGVYGWGPANASLPKDDGTGRMGNYVADSFSVWTSRENFTTNDSTSKFKTGGSQTPIPTYEAVEFFHDWFYTEATNVRLEAAADDVFEIWIRDDLSRELHYAKKGGTWNDATPYQANLNLSSNSGWYQIICQAKETHTGGGSPAYVGAVLWDRDKHGDDGPQSIKNAKAGYVYGYGTQASAGCIWTTRMAGGYVDSNDVGSSRWYYKNGSDTPMPEAGDDLSDRIWWVPQQHKCINQEI